jgi:hypothetical protein
MKKTVQQILGAAVALAMTASGALATQGITNITSLPAVISQPGNYALHFSNGRSDVTVFGAPDYNNPGAAPAAIQITASNVTLDLSGLTIHCTGNGILVGAVPGSTAPAVDSVMITNGAVDGKVQLPYYGLVIGYGSTHVTVSKVNFTGLFGYNADYGAHSTLSFCNFSGALSIASQGAAIPGYNHYENLTLTINWASQANPIALWDLLGGPNSFSLISVTKGNVQLLPSDTGASSITVDTADGYTIKGGQP